MNALADRNIEKAFFISPIVNMEKLIAEAKETLANAKNIEL